MCRSRNLVAALSFLVVASVSSPAAAIPILPDTFEDGTTMGWSVGGQSPLPPTNVATGGPDGSAYLELRANGIEGQPGSRLSALNAAQWMGDYLAAGITAIQMDVRNLGPEDVTLRLLLENFDELIPGPPTDAALTLDGVFVPAGSDWMTVVFDLTNLAALPGGTVEGALGDVDVLRIFHNPEPNFAGPPNAIPPVNVTLGVDNIAAIGASVPEPATTTLLLTGLATALVRARRRRTVPDIVVDTNDCA
jgi:hypothetical protein